MAFDLHAIAAAAQHDTRSTCLAACDELDVYIRRIRDPEDANGGLSSRHLLLLTQALVTQVVALRDQQVEGMGPLIGIANETFADVSLGVSRLLSGRQSPSEFGGHVLSNIEELRMRLESLPIEEPRQVQGMSQSMG